MSERVAFGDFVLDFDARELVRRGKPVTLSPKAFDLLSTLVRSRPAALSKVQLQEQLWPDTFVVEKNLTNLIAEIRKALGESPAHARFIRTVHRFGYAFRDTPGAGMADARGGRVDVRFRLEWIGGRAELTEGDYVLGRDPQVDVFIDSPGVSRRHARIRVAGGLALLEDLDSKNGTYIDGVAVRAATALLGAEAIRIGDVQLTIRELPALRQTRTESSPGSA